MLQSVDHSSDDFRRADSASPFVKYDDCVGPHNGVGSPAESPAREETAHGYLAIPSAARLTSGPSTESLVENGLGGKAVEVLDENRSNTRTDTDCPTAHSTTEL